MRASDVVAIIAAVSSAVLVGALTVVLHTLVGTLRDLRAATTLFIEEAVPLVDEMRGAVRDAGREVDRVERLVTAAGGVTEAVDSAQRLAYRTLASPVVKAMAFGAGVSRGARRLREGEDAPALSDAGSGRSPDTADAGSPTRGDNPDSSARRSRRRGRGAA